MTLLEREQALAALRGLLRQAAGGQGCLLFLGGEAGVGKSALLGHFIAEVPVRVRALIGHCDALSTPRPLGPLFDMDDPALAPLLERTAPRDDLFRMLLAGFASGTRPTLLAIEDAHWADEPTLDLLRYLGRRIAGTRTLAVVTYRNDEVGPRHRLRRLLGDLATTNSVQHLNLAPLSLASVSALAAGSGLDAVALHERTRGNPFFVTEVVAAGGEIPPSVRDAVLARASRLEPAAWAALEAVAVVGTPAGITLLDEVIGRDHGGLDACLESGMLLADGHSIAFRHELAREAILTAISAPRRAALHRAILHVLEAAPVRFHNKARLAHHAEGANDAAAVLRHAPEAAQRAARLRAHGEATDQYERALRFADALPEADRARLLEAHATECYLTSRIDQGIASRKAALDIWITLEDRGNEGNNQCQLAILYWAAARFEDADQEANGAIATLQTLPESPALALAYATRGRLRGPTVSASEGITWGARAIALADRFGAVETLADALIDVGALLLAAGNDCGREQIERGVVLAAEAGWDELVARAYHNLGFGYGEQYRFDLAAQHFAAGIAFCAERDLDHQRHYMTAWLAYCRYFQGDWDEAVSLARSVLEASDDSSIARFSALYTVGMVHARRGEPESGTYLDEALAVAMSSGSWYQLCPIRAARAEAAWLAGDVGGTIAEAAAAHGLAMMHSQRWYAGELPYWRWKCGDELDPAVDTSHPFGWQITGEWERAAAAWDALGCPYEAARARAERSDESALRGALATFDALGAMPAAEAARRRMRDLGTRAVPRGPRPSTRRNPAGLTTRELDVLLLLAANHGNPDIAHLLYISPRTVETHVRSILAKLGAANRVEASAAARRLGIGSQSQ